MIDEKKLINYIKTEINPYGRPFEGTVFEFGCKVMEHIENMEKVGDKWNLCSERLPEKDGVYLCTMDGELCGEAEPFTGMCGIENGVWDEPGSVIAWMPLPEPYNPNTCKNTECPFYCPKQDCEAKEGCAGYTEEPLDPEWKRNFMNRFIKSE